MNVKLLLKRAANWRVFFLAAFITSLTVLGVSAFENYAPTVSSDKLDYSPGEVAIITGYGWTQDSLVDVHFEETPAFHAEHQHDYHGIKVNSDGSWTIRYQIEARHLGVAFDVHVVGKQSGAQAHTYFTDGEAQIKSIDKTTFSPVLPQTLSITSTNKGAPGDNKEIVMGVRIKSGGINGDIVWQSEFISVPNNSDQLFNWDGKNNHVGPSNGKFVPNGDYFIIAVKKEDIYKGQTYIRTDYTETLRDPALYKKVTVVNQVQPIIEWATAGTITYGTTLDGKLSAVAKHEGAVVAGTYEYKQGTTVVTNSSVLTFSASAYPLTVTFTPNDASQFFGATGTNSITIAKKELTVTAEAKNKTYDGHGFTAFTSTITGFVNNETASLVTGSVTYTGEAVSATDYRATAYTITPVVTDLSATNYSFAAANGGLTIGKADANVVVTVGGPYTYDNTAKSVASAVVTGVAGADLGAATVVYKQGTAMVAAPTNAGDYEVHASFAGNNNYKPASDNSKVLTIGKARTTTVVTITGAPFTYTGSAITPASVSVTGPGLNESPAATYANNTNAGTATASYSYAESANHLASSESTPFTIGKADATIVVTGKTVTYDGAAHGASGSAKGVKGETLAGLDLGASFTNAGDHTASWVFTDVTGNYNNASGTAAIKIGKADATTVVTLAAGPFTYTGSAITPATVKVTGANGLNLTPAADYSNNVNAGEATASYTYAETANYFASSDSKTFTIGKANATIALSSLEHMHDGNVKLATATSLPTGLSGISISNNGKTDLGTYVVTASLDNANYQATAVTGNLVIHAVPTVTISEPAPAAINSIPGASVVATFTGTVNNPEWVWSFNANGKTATVSGNKITGANTHGVVGVYTVQLKYQNALNQDMISEKAFVVFYDPSAGFVTGGGWITSKKTDYIYAPVDAPETGRASFGFVSKYEKGAKVPTGNTQFQFNAVGMNFKSSVYEWLTVSGSRAQYKGSGTINGLGDYGFLLTAVDGEVNGKANDDRFRIKIWDKASNTIVYDNQMGSDDEATLSTVIGGGSIVIHQPTKTSSTKGLVAAGAIAPESVETTKFQNYPNPYNDRTTITFSSVKAESFALEVYDVKGALVRKVDMGVSEAGKIYSYEFESRTMPEGMYFARLITNSGVQTIKMVLKK